MKKETISGKQFAFLLFMYLNSGVLLMGQNAVAGADSWLSLLLAAICILPFYFIYIDLLKRHPQKDFFAILKEICGPKLGKFLITLYVLYAIVLASFAMSNHAQFLHTISLIGMPLWAIMIFMAIIVFLVLRMGFEVLARWIEMVLPVLLAMLVLTGILTLTESHTIDNFTFLYDGVKPVFIGGFHFLSFPFGEALLLFGLLDNVKCKKWNLPKTVCLTLFLTTLFIMSNFFRNLSILGPNLMSILNYPTYEASTLIDAGIFIERIESIVSTNFVLSDFIKTSICLLFAARGLQSLFNQREIACFAPYLILISFAIALFVFPSIIMNQLWIEQISYWFWPLLLLLPLFLWLFTVLQQKREKNKATKSAC